MVNQILSGYSGYADSTNWQVLGWVGWSPQKRLVCFFCQFLVVAVTQKYAKKKKSTTLRTKAKGEW